MKNKKSICFIVPSLQMGGMERVVSLISNYANKINYKIYIVCLITSEAAYTIDEGIEVISPPFIYKDIKYKKIKVFLYLIDTLRNIKPDAILAFSEVFNPISIVAAKLTRTRVFISDRSSPEIKIRFIIQVLRQITYPFANGMISQTVMAKELALKRGYNKNIAVIPNPLKEINNKHSVYKYKRIISVGRLISTKNFKELIDIFHEVDVEKDWQLWIVGDGPEREILQSRIYELAINNRVNLVGAVDNVDYYLAQSSIFAFTSLSEGFPNVISEALATPLPCIAYDCPAGPSDLIQHGLNGFLIGLNDRENFKRYLKELMESKSLRESLITEYSHHREKYNVTTISNRYLNFVFNSY